MLRGSFSFSGWLYDEAMSQQPSDELHSPEPLLHSITLQLLIINLHPTGLWMAWMCHNGPQLEMTVHCQTVQNIDCAYLLALYEFVLKLSALRTTTLGWYELCIKGMIFIAQESTWEWNSTAQLIQTKLICIFKHLCWHKTWRIYSKTYSTYI